jgi:cytochrome c553
VKKVLKWLGITVGVLVLVAIGTVGAMVAISSSAEAKHYEVNPGSVPVPEGAEALAEGQRLFTSRGCAECHGADGGGNTIMDAPPGLVAGSNLTTLPDDYSEEDFNRAIRHGIAPDGRPLIFMPSHEYYMALSDSDVGHIIGYIRSMPVASGTPPQSEIRTLGRVLHVTGAMAMLPAELVDHEAPRPADVPVGPTKEYGERLATPRPSSGCRET